MAETKVAMEFGPNGASKVPPPPPPRVLKGQNEHLYLQSAGATVSFHNIGYTVTEGGGLPEQRDHQGHPAGPQVSSSGRCALC